MDLLDEGDEVLHYEDGSHRWPCPNPKGDRLAWQDRVAGHIQRHRENPDAGYAPDRLGDLYREPRRPR